MTVLLLFFSLVGHEKVLVTGTTFYFWTFFNSEGVDGSWKFRLEVVNRSNNLVNLCELRGVFIKNKKTNRPVAVTEDTNQQISIAKYKT